MKPQQPVQPKPQGPGPVNMTLHVKKMNDFASTAPMQRTGKVPTEVLPVLAQGSNALITLPKGNVDGLQGTIRKAMELDVLDYSDPAGSCSLVQKIADVLVMAAKNA